MTKELFKYAGFNSALLALLMILISPFPLHAQTEERFTKEEIKECREINSIDSPALAVPKDFWQQAWGRELAAGKEGMVLQETNSTGVWEILVGNKASERYVDRGTFVEETRHAVDLGSKSLDKVYKQAAKVTHLQRYVMTGTVVGSTGISVAVTAMVTELGNDNDKVSRIFSILHSGTDSGKALAFAEDFVNQLEFSRNNDLLPSTEPVFEKPGFEKPGFEKSGSQHCVNQCYNTRTHAYESCELVFLGCEAVALGAAVACAVACSAATGGLGIPICLAGCDLVLIGATALCLAAEISCRDAALTNYLTCVGNCPGCVNSVICGQGSNDS